MLNLEPFTSADSYKYGNTVWDVSSVADMSHMFEQNEGFNSWINGWNTGNVHDFSAMFRESIYSKDISGFDLGSCTDVSKMFEGAGSFNQGGIVNWDVSSVKHFNSVLFEATSFKQDLCGWGPDIYVSKPDVQDMFIGTNCPNPWQTQYGSLPVRPLCYWCY